MAVTVKGHVYKMSAAADVLNAATIGHAFPQQPAQGPYKVYATLISISSGAGGAIVLTNAGQDIFTFTMAANTMYNIAGSDPMELEDFTVTTLAAGYVIVFATP
jgi:hypothetical protein